MAAVRIAPARRAVLLALVLLAAASALAGCRGRQRDLSDRRPLVAAPTSTAPEGTVPSTTAAPATTAPATTAAAGCPAGRAHAAGTFDIDITSGGVARHSRLYVPTSYHGDRPAPLVIDLHGYGTSGAIQLAYGDFRPLADRDGFLIVAPDGHGASKHFNFFTAGRGEPDDTLFVSDLVDRLSAQFCIDGRRVFSAGMSNGGAMTVTLACRLSGRIAAFGPVAAEFYAPACDAARPVPIAAFHGTADPVVPFNGGQVTCCTNPTVQPTAATMAAWAAHDQCSPSPTIDRLSPMVERRRWTGCAAGSEVVLYVIDGGGHTWPGGPDFGPDSRLGPTTGEISASEVLWAFFQAHPLP